MGDCLLIMMYYDAAPVCYDDFACNDKYKEPIYLKKLWNYEIIRKDMSIIEIIYL